MEYLAATAEDVWAFVVEQERAEFARVIAEIGSDRQRQTYVQQAVVARDKERDLESDEPIDSACGRALHLIYNASILAEGPGSPSFEFADLWERVYGAQAELIAFARKHVGEDADAFLKLLNVASAALDQLKRPTQNTRIDSKTSS